jgi:hypothetical protein
MVYCIRENMKKTILIISAILIILILTFIILRSQEDTWIKDKRGVWIKHGNPGNTPGVVSDQQLLITNAQNLYQTVKKEDINLSSGPCLGQVESDWVVDEVHSPRTEEDDQAQNQCSDFVSGKVHHFIELDLDGNVVKVN